MITYFKRAAVAPRLFIKTHRTLKSKILISSSELHKIVFFLDNVVNTKKPQETKKFLSKTENSIWILESISGASHKSFAGKKKGHDSRKNITQ